MTRRTQRYFSYIRGKAWKLRKAQIVLARGRKCEICGVGDYVQLHHKTYERLGHELDSDLQLLCIKCHKKADQSREAETRYRNARATYIRKKYGDHPPPGANQEFAEWLARKREGQDQ